MPMIEAKVTMELPVEKRDVLETALHMVMEQILKQKAGQPSCKSGLRFLSNHAIF